MAKRKYHRKLFGKSRTKGRFLSALKFLLSLSLLFVFFSLVLFVYYAKDLPRPEKFTERHLIQSTKIYDRTGKVLLYDIHGEEKRTYVSSNKIPDYLKKAVVATEDANFYNHFGIDIKGIIRAILSDIKVMRPVYGGSTIPQQLIRSSFLTLEKTAERKIREIILSLELDRRYSKEQILEWYLNQVPFGQNTYGAEEASQTYFQKSVSDISLAEAATLVSLIKAPSYLSSYTNREELLSRKNSILERMASLEYISEEEKNAAKIEELEFTKPREVKAPYFTLEYIQPYLVEKYGEDFLREKGLKVYTTLDWELQQAAEKFIEEGVATNKGYGAYNAALVAIDPKTGEILALVGGAGYEKEPYPKDCLPGKTCKFDPQFNVVTLGLRQPGSAFKPFVYATAFRRGYTPDTIVGDERTNFGIWGDKEYIPENYDGRFRGAISLRSALAQSVNVASVKVLYLAGKEEPVQSLTIDDFKGEEEVFIEGLKNSLGLAKEMGITTLDKPLSSYGPSIVLGGGEVKLLELTSAYGVFATDGLKVPPVGILRIEDIQGNIIEKNKNTLKRVLPSQVARIINDVLSDNEARAPMFGSNSPLYFKDEQVAAKTGTTQNYQDAWTIGYSPSIVVGVWAGNNDNSPTLKKPGVVLAGPIFHKFMEEALKKLPKENFILPEISPEE
jgi:membrane peptidoglycan carboxypeptidase